MLYEEQEQDNLIMVSLSSKHSLKGCMNPKSGTKTCCFREAKIYDGNMTSMQIITVRNQEQMPEKDAKGL
jgi:hypothetical protein